MSDRAYAIDRMRSAWRRFWFEPASANELGICRCLFFTGVFICNVAAPSHHWGHVPKIFYHRIGLFALLQLPLLSAKTLQTMEVIWYVTLLLAAAGACARSASLIAALLGAYLLGLPNSSGKVGHGDQLTVLIMLMMPLCRCGDGFSLDRLFAQRRGNHSVPDSPDYRWPIRMVWVLMSCVFFAAGVTKLRRSGVDWIMSDNFAIILR